MPQNDKRVLLQNALDARRLTTLAPPVEKMAQIGVELMLDSIRNKDRSIMHNIFLKPELIVRETT